MQNYDYLCITKGKVMEKRSIHAKKRVNIYTLMSYVSHVCSITYKTYDIQNYILLSRGMVFKIPFLRDLLVSCFGTLRKRAVLGGLRLQPLGEPPQCFQGY